MPTSMIGDRTIVYSHEHRRWFWRDTGEMLDEEVEALHFSTDPPGQADEKPARRGRAKQEEAEG